MAFSIWHSALLAVKVTDESDDTGPKTHSRADQVHNIHRPNVGKAWTTEHAEKAEDTKRAENEEDAKG